MENIVEYLITEKEKSKIKPKLDEMIHAIAPYLARLKVTKNSRSYVITPDRVLTDISFSNCMIEDYKKTSLLVYYKRTHFRIYTQPNSC